jgi:general secretion pathway protein F
MLQIARARDRVGYLISKPSANTPSAGAEWPSNAVLQTHFRPWQPSEHAVRHALRLPVMCPLPMSTPLSDHLRAQVHSQLAALERAGVPVADAVGMLRLPRAVQERVTRVARELRAGRPLADAGADGGLFTPLEAAVLRAATLGGSPASAHERLGKSATARARRAAQLRARLLMPLFVLTIALFVQPLPALVSGSIGGGEYLWRSVGTLTMLAGGVAALQHLIRRHSGGSEGPGRIAIEGALLRLPFIGELLTRAQAQAFFENLALLLGSGVAMFDALPAAASTLSFRTLRARFDTLLPLMQAGASLATAARTLDCLGNEAVIGMIATGEGSGTLPELLTRHAHGEGQLVSERQELLATWIPRIVYGALLLWMAMGLIGGASLPRRDLAACAVQTDPWRGYTIAASRI